MALKFFQVAASEKFARDAFAAAGIDYDAALAAKNTNVLKALPGAVSSVKTARPNHSEATAQPPSGQARGARLSAPAQTGVARARASFDADVARIQAKINPPRSR